MIGAGVGGSVFFTQHRSRHPFGNGVNPSVGHCSTQPRGRVAFGSDGQKTTQPPDGSVTPEGQASAHFFGRNGASLPSGHRGTGQHGSTHFGGRRLPSLGHTLAHPQIIGSTPAGHAGLHPAIKGLPSVVQTSSQVFVEEGAGDPL